MELLLALLVTPLGLTAIAVTIFVIICFLNSGKYP